MIHKIKEYILSDLLMQINITGNLGPTHELNSIECRLTNSLSYKTPKDKNYNDNLKGRARVVTFTMVYK
jgi:hypothetical protein